MNNRFLEKIINNFEQNKDEVFCKLVKSNMTKTMTWSDLEFGCRTIIGNLAEVSEMGVVLIFLRHREELFTSYLGCMLGGFIPSFMPCKSPRQDSSLYWNSHQALVEHINPVAIISSDDVILEMQFAGLIDESQVVISVDSLAQKSGQFTLRDKDDIALLQHSSGTTGLKKGVALSYRAIHEHSISYAKSIALCDEDVIVSWLPLYHDMGLMACLITPAFHSVEIVQLDPFEWVGNPRIMFEAIAEHSGTFCWLPNFAFEHLATIVGRQSAQFDLTSMRAFINCSEPCNPLTFDRFLTTFANSGVEVNHLQCCYAMAETVFGVSQTQLNRTPKRICVEKSSLNIGNKIEVLPTGSDGRELIETGKILQNLEVTIINEDGTQLDDGIIGEIAISGDFLFDGYYLNPSQTSEHLKDGVYHTRDLGFILDNSLFVLGRFDDLIIIQGRNIYGHQIESILKDVKGVKPGRTVALGLYDEKVGSESLLLIVERDNSSSTDDSTIKGEIVKVVQSLIDVVPKVIKLVNQGWLLKTTSGKIGRLENLKKYISEKKG